MQPLRMIYFDMTQSIVQCGIAVWDGLGIVSSNKILRTQKYNKNNIK